jgi:hypothetical protein
MHAHAQNTHVVSAGRRQGMKVALAALVERTVLRIANSLGLDARMHPDAAKNHAAYVNGAILMAETLGHITGERALWLRAAAGQLIGGAGLPATSASLLDALRGDEAYTRIVTAVRRAGGATLATPVELSELGLAGARDMLERMQRDGVLKAPDMFGHYAVATVEH